MVEKGWQKETVSTSANDLTTRPYRFYGRSATELNKGRRSRDVGSAPAVALHGITPYRVRQPKPNIKRGTHSTTRYVCVPFQSFPKLFPLFFFFFFFYYSLSSAHCFQPPHKEDRKSFLFFRITQALATRPSISNYEYIILFCRIEYLSKMFGEYLRNTHFSLLVFIQCRQNKKIFGLCTI